MSLEPIKIFIGTSSSEENARIESAHEHSLRANCRREISIEWLRNTGNVDPFWKGWNDTEWDTSYSGFRWGIPEHCNFKGRAIYMDVGVFSTKDISYLHDLPIPSDKWILGTEDLSVSLWDNEKFLNHFQLSAYWKHDSSFCHYLHEWLSRYDYLGSIPTEYI